MILVEFTNQILQRNWVYEKEWVFLNKVFVSTSCLKNPRNLSKVLDKYQKGGIENVELGSIHSPFDTKILKN